MVPRRSEQELKDPQENVWFALKNPIRIKIIEFLKKHGPSTQTETSRDVHVAVSSAKHHIGVLIKVGIVKSAGTRPGPNSITEKLFTLTGKKVLKVKPKSESGFGEMFAMMIEALRVGGRLVNSNPDSPAAGFIVDNIHADDKDVLSALQRIQPIISKLKKDGSKNKHSEGENGMLVAYYPIKAKAKTK